MLEPRPAPDSNTLRTTLGSVATIVLAALLAYHNTWHGPFVFDDGSSVATNPTIRKLWPLTDVLATPITNVTAQNRPLLNLSLAINYALGGTGVEGYHVANLLIHTLAGLALFGIVRRTWRHWSSTARRGGAGEKCTSGNVVALTIAVLWVVHPLQTESVTYIIQRAESLVGLFYLLTLYGFVRAMDCHPLDDKRPARSRAGWLGFSAIACLLGMATKEVMVTAPLMLLFFDRTFHAGTFLTAWRQRRGYYCALAGTWLLLGLLIARGGGNRGGSVGFGVGVHWWEYSLTQFVAIGQYLRLTFWPHPLVFEYGSFWINAFSEIVLQVAIVFGLLAATIYALWRRLAVGFLGAWFFGILAPTSLAPGTTQMIVEHRMYLPLAAVITLMAGVLYRILNRHPRRAVWLAASVTVALTAVTVARNADYHSDVVLWTDTVAKRPKNPLAHFMRGGALERAGDLRGAIASYQEALELKPDFSIGHENLGELLLREGQRAQAIEHFESALRLQPNYADAHANLGNAYLAERRMTEAVGHLERAVQLMPGAAATRYNYGNALAAAGLPADAIAEFEAAVQRDPTMAEAHFNLANLLLETGRPTDAITHFEAAVKIRPDYATARYNLANTLAASGRPQDAIAHYEAAIRARPDYTEARNNLAGALFETGRLPEAVAQYEATLNLRPDFPNARANLERVRVQMKPPPP